ncbi:hypothetical protein HZA98_04195 [Candidatus Woesearchaeota archaeon]|nr:hypothetical protein [Candidatus Woesearchaeota archaeon]
MAYAVYHSESFDKLLNKYPKEFQDWMEKIEDQLFENPYVGDSIRVPWLREKKHHKIRVYYLIYDDMKAVYLVAISEKKDQQRVINTLFLLLNNFGQEIKDILKNQKIT